MDARARVGALFVFAVVYLHCICGTVTIQCPTSLAFGWLWIVPASWLSNHRMWVCHFRVSVRLLHLTSARMNVVMHHFLATVFVYLDIFVYNYSV